MKTILIAAVFAALATPALAQPNTSTPARQAAAASSAALTTDGEVRKIDLASKKIAIKHGEIRNLGMPPMTMIFTVSDAATLAKLKVGDKIRFVAGSTDAGLVANDIRTLP